MTAGRGARESAPHAADDGTEGAPFVRTIETTRFFYIPDRRGAVSADDRAAALRRGPETRIYPHRFLNSFAKLNTFYIGVRSRRFKIRP